MGLRDFIAKRREQTQIGNAERARDKDEERTITESARREGHLEGLKKGARERGLREGERKGLGGGGLRGLLSPAPQTVTTRTVRGKGKNRRVTTTTRQVKKGGLSAGLKGLGFDIGGPSAEGFSLGGSPSEGIGFGDTPRRSRGKRRDSDWEDSISF